MMPGPSRGMRPRTERQLSPFWRTAGGRHAIAARQYLLPSISVLAARSLRKFGAAAHAGDRARGDVWNGEDTLESGSIAEDSTMLLSVRIAVGCVRVWSTDRGKWRNLRNSGST